MRPVSLPLRLLGEIILIFLPTQAAIAFLLPRLGLDLGPHTTWLANALLIVLVASPPVYWRCLAATRRAALESASVRPPPSTSAPVRSAVLMTAAAQALGLGLTAAAIHWQQQNAETLAKIRFDQAADRIETETRRRFALPLYGLMGARGMYATGVHVTRKDFQAYVHSRDLAREFPGIRGLGFIQRVPRDDLPGFIARERADAAPEFEVKTTGQAADLYVIKYIEPLANNVPAWGFDVGQEARRRAAAEHAVDSGKSTLTRPITLVQDGRKGPGFLLYLPVFRPDRPLETAAQRRGALIGLLYAPIVTAEVMSGVIDAADRMLDLELFEAGSVHPDHLLFNSSGAAGGPLRMFDAADIASRHFVSQRHLRIGGQDLVLRLSATSGFEASIGADRLVAIGVAGVLASALLSLSVWLLAIGRIRAQRIADHMTADLDRLARVVKLTGHAVLLVDEQQRITWVNEGFTRVSGFSLEESVGCLLGERLSSDKTDRTTLRRLEDAIRDGRSCRVELLNRAKDGTEYWLDIDLQPGHGTNDRPTGFIVVGSDITARKQVYLQLATAQRETEALLRTVNQHAIVSVADREGRIIGVNEAFCQISGYEHRELIGQDHSLLNSHTHPPRFWAEMWQAIGRGSPWRGEICNRTKSGELYWVDSMIAPFMGPDGRIEKYVSIRFDITESKVAQARLAETAARLSLAIEGGSEGLWDWPNIRVERQWWSPSFYALIGQNPAQVPASGPAFEALVHQDHRPLLRQAAQDAMKGVHDFEVEFLLRTGNAGYRWFRSRAKVFHDDDGQAMRMAGSMQDIHDRRLAELALRESKSFVDRVTRIAGVGGWQVGLSDGRLTWSDEAHRIYGVPRGQTPTFEETLSFYDPQGRDALRAAAQRCIADGTPWDIELPMRRRDARQVWVRVTGELERENGQPTRLVGAVVDITERHALNERLRQNNALLAGVIENLPCGLAVFDEDERLITHNTQLAQLLSLSPSALADGSARFGDVDADASADLVGTPEGSASLSRLLAERTQDNGLVFERARHDGLTLEARGAAMPSGGFVLTYTDVTPRKHAEALLKETLARAEQANVAKSQFLANMSHEIRTPMNAILGMLTLLQRTGLTDRQREYTTKTEGAARSLLSLLDDILDFSKVEAGKMTLDPRPFQLDKLLRNLSVILSASVGDKGIEMLFDIDPDVPRSLVGDDLRLQQVLINLAGNAIKFTEHGEVVLRVTVVARDDDTAVLGFGIRDTGIGIAPEHLDQIFRGFSQAESSTTRRFGGTGLGLAISQRLVSLMGDEIRVESTLGHGSHFHFQVRFPLGDASEPVENVQEGLTSLNVLIVDDVPIARELMRKTAGSLGWRIEDAASGLKALDRVREAATVGRPYDAVFVDWQMPGLDGWQTCARIRQAGGPTPPALIMVSANGRDWLEARHEGERSLIDGFLVKPATASMLLDAVADARAGRGQSLRPALEGYRSQRRLEGLRLLVVEDNANNRQVAQELLADEGALVALAENGERGVAAVAVATPPFDAVLMDLQMPEMDGYTATRKIREELRLPALPIIAMTANAMATDREACLAAGMNDHVGKPFDLDTLVATVRRHVGRPVSETRERAPAPAMPPGAVSVAHAMGIDLPGTLERLGGHRAIYQRMLRSFREDIDNLAARLREVLPGASSDDGTRPSAPEVERLVHTHKGLAATLGLNTLAERAARLEQALHDGAPADTLQPLRDALIDEGRTLHAPLEDLVKALDARVPAPGPRPQGEDRRPTEDAGSRIVG